MKSIKLSILALLVSFASYAQVAPITGPLSICDGTTGTYSDATSGGHWTSGTPTVATIGTASGIATGVTAGVAVLTYTVGGSSATFTVTVNPIPPPITAASSVCVGSSTTITDPASGGTWASSSPAVGTIDFATGVFTGITAGSVIISYVLPTGCGRSTTISVVTSSSSLYTVTGGGSYCAGGTGVTVGLSGSQAGVSYQLYNGVAAVGSPITGTGAAITFGSMITAGTYTVVADPGTSCAATMTGSATITINPLPAAYAVTGGGSYCAGGTGVHIGLASSTAGIIYQLYNGATAVGSAISGSGSALDFGLITAAGTYTIVATDATTGCTNNMTGSATVTIDPLPTSYAITGGGSYCAGGIGSDIVLSGSDMGVNYQLYAPGVPVGLPLAGTGAALDFGYHTTAALYTIYATSSVTTCSNWMTGSVTISVVSVPTVTATPSTATCGGVVTLSAAGASTYSWAPSTGLSCSTCGTTTITPSSSATYTVTGTDTGCFSAAVVSVDGNRISGHITYTGLSTDSFKVWLIQFNPADSSISALDSTTSCMDAGVPYYEFMDRVAGNYMVKAKLNGTVPGTSGYIPTYSSSTPNWYSAASVTHASSADVMNITMVYGTVPSGPGFISGFVVSGAGRGTSGDVPAVGMLIYLKDLTGHVITYTYTDATGAYSFNSIANGSYLIYPEDYKYYTTPSAVITLTPTSEVASAVNFKQHTTFGTITPTSPTSLQTMTASTATDYFPNPTNGVVNIANKTPLTGGANQASSADVTITDITGNTVYKTVINIDPMQKYSQVNVSALANGMYFINYKCETISYTGKLLIVK